MTEDVKERRGAENQREILLSAEKAESRRFKVVKVDFNFGVVLKVPRANESLQTLRSYVHELIFSRALLLSKHHRL